MTEETPPPRRSLATFLRGKPEQIDPTPLRPDHDTAPVEHDAVAATAPAVATTETSAVPNEVIGPTAEVGAEQAAAYDSAAAAAMPGSGTDLVSDDLFAQPPRSAPTSDSHGVSTAASPSFLQRDRHPASAAPTPRWQWLLIVLLTLALLLQVAVADRARLAASAATRPLITTLCGLLRCTVPAWHEPEAFSMLSRDIRPLTDSPGALQVQASFRNDARWAQAWPALRLSLSDADGRVIARRRFEPSEYLGTGYDPAQRLEPQQSAQVSFRLREPAAATVAFNFDFQ